MSKKHTVILSDVEQRMLDKLIREKGFRKQDLFRSNLRGVYRKEYPPYKVREKWKDRFTNKDYCTKILGGKIEGENCRMDYPNGYTIVPLERVKIHF